MARAPDKGTHVAAAGGLVTPFRHDYGYGSGSEVPEGGFAAPAAPAPPHMSPGDPVPVRSPITVATELGLNVVSAITPYGAIIPVGKSAYELGSMAAKALGITGDDSEEAERRAREITAPLTGLQFPAPRAAAPAAAPRAANEQPTARESASSMSEERTAQGGRTRKLCYRIRSSGVSSRAVHKPSCSRVAAAEAEALIEVPCDATQSAEGVPLYPAPCCRPDDYLEAAAQGTAPSPVTIAHTVTKTRWAELRDAYYGEGKFDPRTHTPDERWST